MSANKGNKAYFISNHDECHANFEALPDSDCNNALGGNLRSAVFESTLSFNNIGCFNNQGPNALPYGPLGLDTKYEFLGCFNDNTNGVRALADQLYTGTLTYGECAKVCTTPGLNYFGRQWNGQCWCGNSLSDATSQGEVTSFQCNPPLPHL